MRPTGCSHTVRSSLSPIPLDLRFVTLTKNLKLNMKSTEGQGYTRAG